MAADRVVFQTMNLVEKVFMPINAGIDSGIAFCFNKSAFSIH